MSVNGVPPGRQLLSSMPLVAPTGIGPGPVPIELAAVEGRNSLTGERVVVVQLVTPAGVTFGFITPTMAKQYGELLQQLGGAGLIVVRPVS